MPLCYCDILGINDDLMKKLGENAVAVNWKLYTESDLILGNGLDRMSNSLDGAPAMKIHFHLYHELMEDIMSELEVYPPSPLRPPLGGTVAGIINNPVQWNYGNLILP